MQNKLGPALVIGVGLVVAVMVLNGSFGHLIEAAQTGNAQNNQNSSSNSSSNSNSANTNSTSNASGYTGVPSELAPSSQTVVGQIDPTASYLPPNSTETVAWNAALGQINNNYLQANGIPTQNAA